MNSTVLKTLISGLIVLVAIGIVLYKYWYYLTNPWTRDGQVHAQVMQIAPRISGPIVNLPIVDNQQLKADDLLFEIDPRTFQAAVKEAQADLQQAQVEAKDAKEEADRARRIISLFWAAIVPNAVLSASLAMTLSKPSSRATAMPMLIGLWWMI